MTSSKADDKRLFVAGDNCNTDLNDVNLFTEARSQLLGLDYKRLGNVTIIMSTLPEERDRGTKNELKENRILVYQRLLEDK